MSSTTQPEIVQILTDLRQLPKSAELAVIVRLATSLVAAMKLLPDEERDTFVERTSQIGSTLVSSGRAYAWLQFAHAAIRQNPYSSLADPLRKSLEQNLDAMLLDLAERGDAGGRA